MKREQEIQEAADRFCVTKCTDEAQEQARYDFEVAAQWADEHPYWRSVKDELPTIHWTMSDTVVVTNGVVLRLAWYHQDEGWHFGTDLTFEPTHWMPLPKLPEKGGEQ